MKDKKKRTDQVDDDFGASVEAAGAATPTAGAVVVVVVEVEVGLTTFSK
jgi:hypothetical protein